MFKIVNKTILWTRGDIGGMEVKAYNEDDTLYNFTTDDIVRFKVMTKGDPDVVLFIKDVPVEKEGTSMDVSFEKDDSRFDEPIKKPTDYWYEVELNPDTKPQTIIGYDETGAKVLTLYPEGGEKK